MKKGMTGNRLFRVAEHPEWGRPGADGAPDHSGPAAGQQPFYRKCLDLRNSFRPGAVRWNQIQVERGRQERRTQRPHLERGGQNECYLDR